MGVFDGLLVLDLSWGTAGPMTTMMLADHGADVIRIEPPEGAPFEEPEGYRVWNRGKRSAVLDLRDPADRDTFLALVRKADVLVETFAPGTAEKLGVGYDSLRALNPRLIYCSITGYGHGTGEESRPGFDGLVAARTGFQWELRGWYGGPMRHVQGLDTPDGDAVPESLAMGSVREGPIFQATPAPSVGASHLASIGIGCALHAREVTGLGQRVDTSLLQGVLLYNASTWQRAEKIDAPGYDMRTVDRRQIWGIWPTADGWVCHWGGNPAWATLAARGDELVEPDKEELAAAVAAQGGAMYGAWADKLRVQEDAVPYLAKFTRDDWGEFAERVHVGMHPIRTPEEALTDDNCLADGSVAEINDPELGALRMAGVLYKLSEHPTAPKGPAPSRGQHTDDVRTLAAEPGPNAHRGPDSPVAPTVPELESEVRRGGPLAGIRVLDFGFAVAGPWTSQLLADLGADVISVDAPGYHAAWPLNHMGMGVNKSKRHLTLDIKNPAAADVLRQLIESADVITHNMRPGAAERLGIEYEKVREINPRVIYLHTRAFEDGPRSALGGHDQAANALGGTMWEDGGSWHGGHPYFGLGSGGDKGNGFLGAIAVVDALYDRDRTGKGQKVDTSILNAALFSCSRVYTTPDGKLFDRVKTDGDQLGFHALYRLYECTSGWLCLAVLSDAHWDALASAIPALAGDARFASAAERRANDDALVSALEAEFRSGSAADWFAALDAAGVPVEVSDETYSQRLFDNQDLYERGWLVATDGHPVVGHMDMVGIGIDFSETPSVAGGPPPWPGQHSREVLRELGCDDPQVDALVAAGAVQAPEAFDPADVSNRR